MIDARFHPLDLAHWPGAQTGRRKSPQFRSPWSSTLDLLEIELRALKAREVVIQAAFEARDIRQDGWPRADARKPSFPGVILSFQSDVGPLRYATDVYTDGSYYVTGKGVVPLPGWQANLRAIGLSLEALRAVDRHGVTKRGEQYVGFGALPAATLALDAPMDEATARDVLDLVDVVLTTDLLSTRFRHLAREHSEDAAALHRVQKARDVLLGAMR